MDAVRNSPRADPRDAAIARAVAFLQGVQLPSGELPVFTSADPEMRGGLRADPSIFPTAVAAQCLAAVPEAAPVTARALDFLAAEMDRHGLWKHWPTSDPRAASLPPDLDDTSCASAALAAAGRTAPDNCALILSNRDGKGRFRTWFVPRLRPGPWPSARATWPMLLRAPALLLFFRATSAAPGDVDAVVNANALVRLGGFDGRERIERWLVSIVEQGEERACDKWYENPFAVRYFLARALSELPEARTLLVRRSQAETAETALDHAFAASTQMACGADPSRHVEALLAGQRADGAWPRAALYHGGRARLEGRGFAAPHPDTPHWGSEALTTAFAVEALARARQAPPR